MKLRCLIGVHDWHGCQCKDCGRYRHAWTFSRETGAQTEGPKNHFMTDTHHEEYVCTSCGQIELRTRTVTYEEYWR
jgi:hypothetical protein